MRALVWMLGFVTALAITSPALHATPAHASTTATTYTDGFPWSQLVKVVQKLWLEAYLLLDRLMDGDRSGGGQGCNCTGTCTCGHGGGGSGGGGDTTGTGTP
jgi:uncharacterized membrane protein YgcG